MKFIRGFKNMFSDAIYTILLVAIAVFSLINALGNTSDLMPFLAMFVPLLLILISAVGLQLKGKTLAAHLVLLLTVFLGAGRTFIYAITSFSFESMSFTANFSVEMLIAFIILLCNSSESIHFCLFIFSCCILSVGWKYWSSFR